MKDTIFALATAPGRAAVAVLRISGPASRDIVRALAGVLPEPRRISLRRLTDGDGAELDRAVVLWLPGPASYTGEDSAELHLHGGPAIVEAVSRAVGDQGARPADPGEFTRRAFENGRMDLAQAEAVADLIDAETEAQRRQALDQLGGALGERHESWRRQLTRTLAVLEAAIDFPDEDLPEDVARAAVPILEDLLSSMRTALADAVRGETVRDGFRIAIIGAPNAGKSSLLNALARRQAAIVTAHAGTTRDVIEAPLVVGGYKVVLADTAGLRASDDEIEMEGIRRAHAWATDANLRIWVVDGSAAEGWDEGVKLLKNGDLCAINKSDLPAGPARRTADGLAIEQGLSSQAVSMASGEGLSALEQQIEGRVVAALGGGGFPAGTRLRHRLRLGEAVERLERARLVTAYAPELAAEDVRLAVRALEQITGRIDAELVLGEVFSSFCIGK